MTRIFIGVVTLAFTFACGGEQGYDDADIGTVEQPIKAQCDSPSGNYYGATFWPGVPGQITPCDSHAAGTQTCFFPGLPAAFSVAMAGGWSSTDRSGTWVNAGLAAKGRWKSTFLTWESNTSTHWDFDQTGSTISSSVRVTKGSVPGTLDNNSNTVLVKDVLRFSCDSPVLLSEPYGGTLAKCNGNAWTVTLDAAKLDAWAAHGPVAGTGIPSSVATARFAAMQRIYAVPSGLGLNNQGEQGIASSSISRNVASSVWRTVGYSGVREDSYVKNYQLIQGGTPSDITCF